MTGDLLKKNLQTLALEEPAVADFLENAGLAFPENGITVAGFFSGEAATDAAGDDVLSRFVSFMEQMAALRKDTQGVRSLTVRKGRTKTGEPESADLHLRSGEIVSVVGPTGAGKSRLLEDIECLACRDTPSNRKVLINGAAPEPRSGWSGGGKLVAQVSQNMNFVMDLSVADFLRLHAESRMAAEPEAAVKEAFEAAADLAGEPFLPETSLTALSGGQSRALMVADTACLSRSPVVLIDELENAGIDKEKALSLLVRREKIILIATHDPMLALLAHRRVVIRNGGMTAVIEKTEEEKAILNELKRRDESLRAMRRALRRGDALEKAVIGGML